MLALDHIVIAGKNAEDASLKYGNQFSIKAIKGGNHTNWGTYNYLSFFANTSYLEWLGIHDEATAKQTDNPLIRHLVHVLENGQTGPFQVALRTKQMDKMVSHFNAHSIPYKGPYSGQRKRPDGSLLSWRMLFPEYDHTKEVLPFLIEWGSPRDYQTATSLLNPQAITKVNFGWYDKDSFAHIYQLKPRKLFNHLPLSNTKLYFTQDEQLTFDLV
ncbi:VOC family protein [Lentibacillus saliphilus]|uniref:VOC family protein n=1 Tax=Lentibacillus saliphilus TaxID=2737028 RepID=UPI001C2FD1F4|nr:VOC family protein [Lentibacillus saliphilus]